MGGVREYFGNLFVVVCSVSGIPFRRILSRSLERSHERGIEIRWDRVVLLSEIIEESGRLR